MGASLDLFSDSCGSSAAFSPCERYRYSLLRQWAPGPRLCLFVMLNPSTADAEKDDPTIRRCTGFAKDWGFDGLAVANIFALRSTDPKALYSADDPIGPENDAWIQRLASNAERVVCAWGNHGQFRDRGEAVLRVLARHRPLCLGITGAAQPVHPLYQPKDAELRDVLMPRGEQP